jgi:hypothetical protein
MSTFELFFKKHWLVNLCFLWVLFLVSSCNKENLTAAASEKPKELKVDASTKFIVDGKLTMTMAEFNEKYGEDANSDNVGNTGKFTPETNNTNIVMDYNGQNYIFTSDGALRTWATSGTYDRIEFINKLDSAYMWQAYAYNRGILDDSLATLAYTDSITAAFLQRNAAPLFYSAIYDGAYYTGQSAALNPYYVGIPVPTFGSMNRRASSYADWFIQFRLFFMASKTWFRGTRFWYYSWTQNANLAIIGFDNMASSKY